MLKLIPPTATDVTAVWSVRPSHSRTMLKPLHEIACHLAGTLLWPQLALCQTGAPVLHGKRTTRGQHSRSIFTGTLHIAAKPLHMLDCYAS